MRMTDNGSLVAAASWVVQTITGTTASAIAVLAIASVGLAAMAGRIPSRRLVRVVVGIAVVFGAVTLSDGLAGRSNEPLPIDPPSQPVLPAVTTRPRVSAVYDPYAGASVPQNRAPSDFSVPVQ